jgi:hypothetical protein
VEEDLRTSFCGHLTYMTLDEIRELLQGEAFESGIRRWSYRGMLLPLTPRQYLALKAKLPSKGA